MPFPLQPPPTGIVVAHAPRPDELGTRHERETLLGFARRLAALHGYAEGGWYQPGIWYPGHLYFVPSGTLEAREAAALGIRGPGDLFGGVVPHAFVGTKAISHPLPFPAAHAPAHWSHAIAPSCGDAVLVGFSCFDPAEAQQAGERLLANGPVRVKPVRASGGRGQEVAADAAALRRVLQSLDVAELCAHGVVLEEQLEDVRTFSVGQVEAAGLLASYYGFQRLTRSNEGLEVFGGSDLVVVRGGFEELLACVPSPEIRQAVDQARRYDAAVQACYPGFYASRRNYDIAAGRDARGHWRSGVLEQSWRVGGATGPELAALKVLQARPHQALVRASCYEVFGDGAEPPPHATVYFRGIDPQLGPLAKFTVVEADVHAR